jgi:ABC-2 type transport system ATP-binding protein
MAASIVIRNLTKRYDHSPTLALNTLNLKIHAGEVYGYLGANGAGKSTTIRLLMNFLQPTDGVAEICGMNSVQESVAIKRRVGYLAGDVALYPKVTGAELLNYLARLSGGIDAGYRRTLEKRFEAETNKPIGTLSKGNRQKIGILQAFMHNPDVLILDEPTSGLDPLMQEAFYETVREARTRGAAVLMSSHNLAEAQGLCDRIGIIKHGKLIHEQAIQNGTELQKTTFRLTLGKASDAQLLKKSPQLKFISQDGTTVVVQAAHDIAKALAALSRYDIRSLTTQSINLEDEFLDFYGDNP